MILKAFQFCFTYTQNYSQTTEQSIPCWVIFQVSPHTFHDFSKLFHDFPDLENLQFEFQTFPASVRTPSTTCSLMQLSGWLLHATRSIKDRTVLPYDLRRIKVLFTIWLTCKTRLLFTCSIRFGWMGFDGTFSIFLGYIVHLKLLDWSNDWH